MTAEMPPKTADVLATARRVLEIEAAAVLAMSNALPADFAEAVALVLQAKGRVVLSGIGKSGHIARKISSTLASTGTPSFFVHPAEASHGDLGMVMPGDVCVLVSNSGETAELGDLIAHARRFSIPIIGISGNENSTLMKAADLRLTLPAAPEACIIGLAPTTSTTLTLALGDALCVAVMEQRGFVSDQFRTFHPGGKLGAQLATVAQLMHSGDDLPLVTAGTRMDDALLVMSAKGFGVALVLDEQGVLAGLISDGDLRRHMDGLTGRTAGEVATRQPRTAPPDMLAAEAVGVMNSAMITALVVTDPEARPVGLLRLHDCLRAGVV
ncbi:KpsF/GutQ family sugar-phosphate isomerase [Flavimaricola marinus]|uniref:Arabinose 5-phosphate isomerase KdsD n=1 Tax=Flavimaricola marinus TaxID=1819565 RepID=A0A238LIE2_9RHOB|nr:KpsF/GutQ family sugar-phosphate isomerase [Flavimaricola marinus]SMY09313.1 Arabinose 5-phosphate isomerase KdsD [Flavimaricola marinus]